MTAAAAPFLEPEFADIYRRTALERGQEFATVRVGDAACSLVQRAAFGVTLAETPGAGLADYMDLQFDEAHQLPPLLAALLDQHARSFLLLRSLVSSSPTIETAKRVAAELDWSVRASVVDVAPYIEISGSFESFARERRSRKALYNLRRSRRLLGGSSVRTRFVTRPDAILGALSQAHAIAQQRPRDGNARWSLSTERGAARIAPLVEALSRRGLVDLAFLEIDDQPIAFSLGLVLRGHYHFWRTAFATDDLSAPHSPGSILLHDVIGRAFELGCTRFDFMRGAEPYKSAWATGENSIVDLEIGSPQLRGRAAAMAVLVRSSIRTRLRDSDVARRLYRTLSDR